MAGTIKPEDDSLVLDVVKWHGEYWSLNNRHLKVLIQRADLGWESGKVGGRDGKVGGWEAGGML